MYFIISKKMMDLCNLTLSYQRTYDYYKATMEDHKKYKQTGLKIYRKYMSYFHPDK